MKTYLCLIESLLCKFPCYLTERWFFMRVGGIREKIATRLVQGYYGAGRYYECYKDEGDKI